LWPHSTLGWPDRTADLARWYPTSVLMTGRDIITLWVARMVMMGMYNMGSAPSPGTPGEGRGEGDLERQSALDKPNHPHPNPLPEYRERGPERGIPFHHVAINPTILDGNGERMAKQKGNGVDPVDVIDSHGADALRFTLTMMATETQEARLPIQLTCPHCTAKMPNPASEAQTAKCPKCGKLYTRALGTNVGTTEAPLAKPTSEKFDLGRNFSTKLWNAAKFVLSNLESVKPRPVVAEGNADSPVTDSISAPGATTGRGFTLADQWIVSRFNRAVDETNAALENYRFDQYAKTCYDFFWRDFCDWYVEAAKPAIKDPARSAATANTLATMLDGILRLMHPMIPFITERLWWKLNEIRPAGRSKRLVLAQWPITGPINDSAEQTFGILQEIIVAIRNVRNQYKIDPKKPVAVSLSVPDNFKSEISNNRELIETLAICTISKTQADLPMPANSARAIVGGIEIFVEGVIDPDAEKARDAKKKETLTREREALIARLANPSYADKAPAHLVQQTRDKLAAVEAELAKLQS
jgi:valyl-tRNA synthetase